MKPYSTMEPTSERFEALGLRTEDFKQVSADSKAWVAALPCWRPPVQGMHMRCTHADACAI